MLHGMCTNLFFSFGLLIVLKNMTVFNMIRMEGEGGGEGGRRGEW